MKENPTIEEPKKEPQKESAEDAAKAILDELGKLGVDTPEKVQGMAKASSEAGNLARMLGELRQQNEGLQRKLETLSTKPNQEYDYGEPVDIKAVIRNELRGFYQEDIVKPQMEHTNRVYAELSDIQGDEDYPMVKEVWDKHWSSPGTQQRIMMGQSSPKMEYDKLVRTYYRQSFKKTYDALKGVMEKRPKAPHVETGDQTHVHTPTMDDEKYEKVKNITKNSQGTDSDIENLVKALLPSDDPMFKR